MGPRTLPAKNGLRKTSAQARRLFLFGRILSKTPQVVSLPCDKPVDERLMFRFEAGFFPNLLRQNGADKTLDRQKSASVCTLCAPP
jgi:hypothetical protein